MRQLIRQLSSWTRLFFNPSGRRRARCQSPHGASPSVLPAAPCFTVAPTVRPWYDPIDGTSTPLVRPYLTAYEHEEKARLQRLRRDALWWATYGVDLDTLDIHAVLGAAS